MSFDLALINNDLNLLPDGKVRLVTDTPKLRQDIIKIVLTPLGSVKNHLWYGCSINEDVIGQNLPPMFEESKIQASILQSLERLKALQISQSAMQKVTLAELIDVIGDVHSERDDSDPRNINIVIVVFSKRLAKIEEVFTLTS